MEIRKSTEAKTTTVELKHDPNTDPEAAREVHLQAIVGTLYVEALGPEVREIFKGFDLGPSAMLYIEDMFRRMAPRDPMEEMLITQAILSHTRVMSLTMRASLTSEPESNRTLNEYADRASNSFRRLMLALGEYRKPPRSGDSFTAIRQANIAGQQVVVNSDGRETESITNEQGCRDGQQPEAAPPSLPTQPGGAGRAPGIGSADEALGAVHRAEHAGG